MTGAAKRSRSSAKAAGARFEREIADWLAEHVSEFVDRRVKTGSSDRGDLTGLRCHGQRVVAELKNTARINLAGWATEADLERGNDDALAGVVISKRHGVGDPARQWVHMELAEFAALLTGVRPDPRVPAAPSGDSRPVSGTRTYPEAQKRAEGLDALRSGAGGDGLFHGLTPPRLDEHDVDEVFRAARCCFAVLRRAAQANTNATPTRGRKKGITNA